MVLQLNRSGGPVPGQSYCAPALGKRRVAAAVLSPAVWFTALGAPAPPAGALIQSWPSAEPRPAQCLGSHTALPRWAGWLKKGKEGALVQRELSANAD